MSELDFARNYVPERETAQNVTASNLLPTYLVALQSQETFATYCNEMQTRLSSQTSQRKRFLQTASDRLSNLLQAALALNDTTLYNEIWQCRTAAQQMLEALPTGTADPMPSAPIVAAPLPVAVAPAPMDTLRNPPPIPNAAPPPKPRPLESIATVPLPVPAGREMGADVPHSRMPRRPIRPLLDIESDAIRIRTEVRTWNEDRPLRKENGELHIPNTLALRSVACRQRKLEEEAGDIEVAEVTELKKDIADIFRNANDDDYNVGTDYEIDPPPTVYQWSELAERYAEMSIAYEAFLWWHEHGAELALTDIQPLAESIAAIQGRFNRLLYRVGARDQFQQHLYEDLRAWAKDAQCYLYSLRPKVPMEELVDRCAVLEESWHRAKEPVALAGHRQRALENLMNTLNAPEFGENPAHDSARLQEAIAACRDLRVSATDRRLRDPLLPWAALLEGDDHFSDILREILVEWDRRLEFNRLEEPSLDENEEGAVAPPALAGKRLFLVGGAYTPEQREFLETALGVASLIWKPVQPSVEVDAFASDVAEADVVALALPYSRVGWRQLREISAEAGKGFAFLPSTANLNAIVKAFNTQLA